MDRYRSLYFFVRNSGPVFRAIATNPKSYFGTLGLSSPHRLADASFKLMATSSCPTHFRALWHPVHPPQECDTHLTQGSISESSKQIKKFRISPFSGLLFWEGRVAAPT